MNNTYPEPYRSAGKDTLIDPSTCYNRECVSYVAWKVAEATGHWLKRTGDMNAKNWIYRLPENGYAKEVARPKDGGKYVGVLTAGQYGHVIWFETGNVISEYNYNYNGNHNTRSIELSTYRWFEIVAPATIPTPKPPVETKPTPTTPSGSIVLGDKVIPTNVISRNGNVWQYLDYNGTAVSEWRRKYYRVSQLVGDRVVLTAEDSGIIWCAMNISNLRKA